MPFARTARGPPGPVVIVMRPLPALPLRRDRLSLAERRPGRQTARLTGRQGLRELVEREERARLRPRVRVGSGRRGPEVAAHRDRAPSGDPGKHAREDDRSYDKCTPKHGRKCSHAARLRQAAGREPVSSHPGGVVLIIARGTAGALRPAHRPGRLASTRSHGRPGTRGMSGHTPVLRARRACGGSVRAGRAR